MATVANNKEVGKFAVAMYAGVLLWVGFFAIVGMGFIWIVSLIAKLTLKSSLFELPPGGWIGWLVYVFAGLLLGILAWYLRLQFIAKRQVSTLRNRLDSTLSAEEKSRFEELNTLFGSSDPAERQRFLKLAAEYRAKIREALK